jgi:hypothetical protein
VDFIQRSILVLTPEIIYFKIEPMGSTKVLTFYSIHHNQNKEERPGDEEEDAPVISSFTFTVKITNNIGISLIDNVPKEILQMSISKLLFTYN